MASYTICMYHISRVNIMEDVNTYSRFDPIVRCLKNGDRNIVPKCTKYVLA